MSKVILDAPALLALLNSEKGKDLVEEVLSKSVMSAISVFEVIAELEAKLNILPDESKKMIETIIQEIIPFNLEQAAEVAKLKSVTKGSGLSLGDRACLALAKLKRYPIYTTDKTWKELNIGVDVQLIR